MLTIKLVRHGQSTANAGTADARRVGDHALELTPLGVAQASAAGRAVGTEFLADALLYCSPYRRARQMLAGMLAEAGLDPAAAEVREDPRLRELDHGYADCDAQQQLRETHGWFYYRYEGGESPADCFDRVADFLGSLVRTAERTGKRAVVIVSHGVAIRCFVMRFLHLTVEQYDSIMNPRNGEVTTIAPREAVADPVFVSGRYAVGSLRLYPGAVAA